MMGYPGGTLASFNITLSIGEKDLRRLKNSVEDWILAGEA